MTNRKMVKKSIIPLLLALAFLLDGVFFNRSKDSNWSFYKISLDSLQYATKFNLTSLTPPVYHWFIQVVGKSNISAEERWFGSPKELFENISDPCYTKGHHFLEGQSLSQKLSNPCYRVIFVQKILSLGSLILLCVAFSNFLPSPLVAIVIFLLYKMNFFPHFANHMMTETLAQTILILIASIFLLFVKKRQRGFLPLAGLLCGIAYLLRPAAAYATILLIFMIIDGLLCNRRSFIFPALLSLLLVGSAYTFETIRTRGSSHSNINTDIMTNLTKFTHACLLANPTDVSLMPDTLTKNALKGIIRLREENNVQALRDCFKNITRPLMNKLGINYFSKDANDLIYKKIQTPILNKYFWEYHKLRVSALLLATSVHQGASDFWKRRFDNGRMRRSSLFFFWLSAFAILLINLLVRTPLMWVSIGFLLVHIANCVISVHFIGFVIYRHISATYCMFIFALLLSLWTLTCRFIRPSRKYNLVD